MSLESYIKSLNPIVYYRFSDIDTGALTGSILNLAPATIGTYDAEVVGNYKLGQDPLPNKDLSGSNSYTCIGLNTVSGNAELGEIRCSSFSTGSWPQGYSATMWVKLGSMTGSLPTDIRLFSYDTPQSSFGVLLKDSNWNGQYQGYSTTQNYTYSNTYRDLITGQTIFLAYVYNGLNGIFEWYENGIQQNRTQVNMPTPGQVSNLLRIGYRSQDAVVPPPILFSNFAMFDRVLTADEIFQIYSSGSLIPTLNQSSGNVVNTVLAVTGSSPTDYIDPTIRGQLQSYNISPAELGGEGEEEGPKPLYVQRLYDLTLGQWVYYELETVTDSPSSSQTVPNGSGNYKLGSHEIMGIIIPED